MAMSEDGEAELVARWLDGIADEARELSNRAVDDNDEIQASAQEIISRLARKWARHVRERRHREPPVPRSSRMIRHPG